MHLVSAFCVQKLSGSQWQMKMLHSRKGLSFDQKPWSLDQTECPCQLLVYFLGFFSDLPGMCVGRAGRAVSFFGTFSVHR